MNRPLRRSAALLLLLLLALALVPFAASAQAVPFQGQLFDRRTSRPAPGLMVSLIHPVLGRSAPSYSDAYGRFGWSAIPLRAESYYLEVYWGYTLIYRQPVRVSGPVRMPAIWL